MNESRLHRIRILAILLFLPAGLAAAPDPDPLAPGEKAAGQWISTRLETSRMETAWTTERPLLEATVTGLKERAQNLEDKRDELKASTAKNREEIESMQAKNAAAADDLHRAEAALGALSERVLALRQSLPPRLSLALDFSYRSLANPSLGASERMQIVMTILNRCAQFNRTVTSDEEALAMDGDAGQKSLEVIYWGLGHAYALDRTAGKAWYGAPGAKGWQWEPLEGGAKPVALLIAMNNDKADPDFVSVAARLEHAQPEEARP
jgi:hypothetical protein